MTKPPLPAGHLQTLRQDLGDRDALAIADELGRLAPTERARIFRLLTKQKALAVFRLLDTAHQEQLVIGLRDEQVLREGRVGLLLGTMLGALSVAPVWLFTDRSLALIIALTLVTVCAWPPWSAP